MSYIHRGFTHPGGVSPMKQEDEKEEKKKEKKKDFDYSGTTPTSEAITHFVTPQNKLELGLEFAGGGVGVGIGKGVSRLAKTKLGKKLISKVPWLKNLTKPITKATKGTEGAKTDFDFSGKQDFSGGKPKGGVDGGKNIIGGKEYYKGATHYGKIEGKDFHGVTNDIFEGVRQTGKVTDDALAKMNFNVATDLKPDHIKKIGNQGGRDIFEVAFPDGTTQKFWRSTGTGGKSVKLADGTKVGSEGFFGTVAGHMDAPPGVLGKPGSKSFKEGVDGWFIKGQGWEGYGSKTYKETGAVLKNFFDKGLIK